MAMLLLRAGGLSSNQKVPLSSLTYTKDPKAGSSSSMIQDENHHHHDNHHHHHHNQQQRSSRSRKSKNGQKKIPQRGLGVAQLEKLRMEEQQKQEAACLASLQRAHALPPLTGTLHSQGAPFVLSHNLARQMKGRTLQSHPFVHHHMSPRNNCPMSDSIISLANLQSMNFKQQLPMGGLSIPQQQSSREENRATVGGGTDRCLSRNSSLGRSSDAVESCVTNVGVPNNGFLSSLWPAHNGNGENLNQEMEMRKMDIFGIRSQNSSTPPSDLHFFEPLLRSPAPARKLPVVTTSSSGATMQMEPPSNQSYSTTPPWTEEDRIAGVKRPWPFSLENPNSPIQHRATCLNIGAGIHVKPEDMADTNPARLELAKQDPGAIFSRSTPKIFRTGQATVKDSCSSSTSLQQGFTLNWKASSENDISSQENETPGGAFLTLGLSSSANEHFHGKESHCKPKQHCVSLEMTDEWQWPNKIPTDLQQEMNGGRSTKTTFPSSGLLKHGYINSTDLRQLDEVCVPFYKFLGYESTDKETADHICQDNKIARGVAEEPVDLNLSLSL